MDIDPASYGMILRNAFTKQYGEATDEWTNDLQMRSFASFVHERLRLPRATRVLDVGCGSGKDVEYLSGIYEWLVGIDIVSHGAWTNISQHKSNVRFECVDLLSYSTGESYNLILDNGCLHHQHPGEIGAYLQKVVRLLDRHRPSYFALSTYKNPTLAERVDQNGRLHKYFTDKEIHEHLRLTHLEVFHEHEVFRPFKGDHYRFSICRIRQNEIASD